MSTLRTAVSTVTASNYAPIMRPTISSGNGAIAAAPRAITFSSGQYCLVKCEWARIFRISVRARRRNRKTLLPPEPQVLQPRPRRPEVHPLLPQLEGRPLCRPDQVRHLPKPLRRRRQQVRP
jgi:hypothetical protein